MVPDFWRAPAKAVSDAIRALKPYGATPIVVIILAFIGVVGLTLKAPPVATVAIVLIAFGAFFYAQERSAIWKRRELENEYAALEKGDGAAVRKKLSTRLQRTKKKSEPTITTTKES